MNIRTYFGLLLLVSLPCLVTAQALEWADDYTGTTQYRAPVGWTIRTQQEGTLATWQAKETPGENESPGILVLAMADPGLDLEVLTTSLLQESAQNLQINQRMSTPNATHLLLKAEINDVAAKVATMALRDQQWVYVGIFAAPSSRFERLGGADVLYQAIRQNNPYVSESTGSTLPSGQLNTQDINVQNRILQQEGSPTAHELVGSWLQNFSMLGGDDYLTNNNAVRTEERGYAHWLDFRSNGSYQLTYRYQSYSAGCPYAAEAVETGSYELRENLLVLSRTSYQADYNICGQETTEQQSNLGQKSFQVATTGQVLILRGAPFEYTISIEQDASGQPYFQEGFQRQ